MIGQRDQGPTEALFQVSSNKLFIAVQVAAAQRPRSGVRDDHGIEGAMRLVAEALMPYTPRVQYRPIPGGVSIILLYRDEGVATSKSKQ